jgi:hypothetical protein
VYDLCPSGHGALTHALKVTGAQGTVKSTAHSLDHSEYIIEWE